MAVTIPSYNDTLNAVITALAAYPITAPSGVLLTPDFNIGSLNMTFAEVMALCMDLIYGQVANVYSAAFIATATGSDLDRHGQLVGLLRNPATYAQALATFSSRSAEGTNVPIAQNAVVLTFNSAGTLQNQYATVTAGQINIGGTTTTITVQAQTAGNAYTIAALTTAQLQTPIAGVDTVTLQPLTPAAPGTDLESDDAYRKRLLSNTFVNRGTSIATINALKQLVNVKGAYVLTDVSGTVTDSNGQVGYLVQALNPSFTADQTALITSTIAGLKNAGVSLVPSAGLTPGWAVLALTAVDVTITVTLFDKSQPTITTALVQTALTNYINSLLMGSPVVFNEIIFTSLGVPNVIDAGSLSMVYKATTYTANVPVLPNEVAGAGTITVNWT